MMPLKPIGLTVVLFMPLAAHTATPTDPDEAVFLQRYRALQQSVLTGLEEYSPLETIAGSAVIQSLPRRAHEDTTVSSQALADARQYAADNRSESLLVWRKGALEHESYFGSVGADETFASRSLAKPMTAIAIGRALQLGYIQSLDQPVSDFLTEWQGVARKSSLKVRHLLDMRSGMLPQSTETAASSLMMRAYMHPQHESILLHEYPFVDEPGTRYEYSNATSELVALLIERASGLRYAQFLSRELLQPLGAPGGSVWLGRPDGLAHSGCCLMLTPETWLRLGVLLLQDGVWQGRRLLPEGFVREMATGTPQNPYYGLGVYVAGPYTQRRGFLNPEREPIERRVLHGEPYLAADLFLFDGNSNQVMYIVPSEQLVVLRTGAKPPKDATREWDNSVLPNILIRGIRRQANEKPPLPQPTIHD